MCSGMTTGDVCNLTGITATLMEMYVRIVCEGCCEQVFRINLDECCENVPGSPTPTPTLTPSTTPSVTPTIGVTQSITPSITPTITPSVTPTLTPSVTPTSTSSTTELFTVVNNTSSRTVTNTTINGTTQTLTSGSYPIIPSQQGGSLTHPAFTGVFPDLMTVYMGGTGDFDFAVEKNGSPLFGGTNLTGDFVIAQSFLSSDSILITLTDSVSLTPTPTPSVTSSTTPSVTPTPTPTPTLTPPSPCLGYVLDSNGESASIEWLGCDGSPMSHTFNGQYTICTNGSAYNVTIGTVSVVTGPYPCT